MVSKMAECCDSKIGRETKTSKLDCPQCGEKCLTVLKKTVLQHLNQPWIHELSSQQFYYCRTSDCDVVYYSKDGEVIYNKSELRTRIGIKEKLKDALICFCFGVSRSEAASDENIKNFVIKQTKDSMCSCETSNPSGRCCLKDFPKFKS